MYWTKSNQIMDLNLNKAVQVAKERRSIPTVSAVLRDGTIAELAGLPLGWGADRDALGEQWVRSENPPADDE